MNQAYNKTNAASALTGSNPIKSIGVRRAVASPSSMTNHRTENHDKSEPKRSRLIAAHQTEATDFGFPFGSSRNQGRVQMADQVIGKQLKDAARSKSRSSRKPVRAGWLTSSSSHEATAPRGGTMVLNQNRM